MSNTITNWMSWIGGVDLCACTRKDLTAPNVIIHLAREVQTPVGSAAAGMILWQPDPAAAPTLAGFVANNPGTGAYFGPKIFAGTPFEHAPLHLARISVNALSPGSVTGYVETGGHTFEVTMSGFGPMQTIHRAPSAMTPFTQSGVEAVPTRVELKVDGNPVELFLPPSGISGGAAAVWSPCGIYAR